MDESGRCPSGLLLVPKIRASVDAWRERGYPGASDVTLGLFSHWFEEDHEVAGFPVPFRYWFCQREAIETLVWLVEVHRKRDTHALIKSLATVRKKDRFSNNISFQTTMDGQCQITRYVPELDSEDPLLERGLVPASAGLDTRRAWVAIRPDRSSRGPMVGRCSLGGVTPGEIVNQIYWLAPFR